MSLKSFSRKRPTTTATVTATATDPITHLGPKSKLMWWRRNGPKEREDGNGNVGKQRHKTSNSYVTGRQSKVYVMLPAATQQQQQQHQQQHQQQQHLQQQQQYDVKKSYNLG